MVRSQIYNFHSKLAINVLTTWPQSFTDLNQMPCRQPASHFQASHASLGETHLRDLHGKKHGGELHRLYHPAMWVSSRSEHLCRENTVTHHIDYSSFSLSPRCTETHLSASIPKLQSFQQFPWFWLSIGAKHTNKLSSRANLAPSKQCCSVVTVNCPSQTILQDIQHTK